MQEWIKHKERYYILADTSLAERHRYVLKFGEAFAIFDKNGNIRRFGVEDEGLYYEGTRYVSRLIVKTGRKFPLLLNAAVKDANDELAVDLTNPDIETEDGFLIKRGTLHFLRSVFLWEGACYERIRVTNFGLEPVVFTFSFEFDADFADIFEVRGIKRSQRGTIHASVLSAAQATLSYTGLDGITRFTDFMFDPAPTQLEAHQAVYQIKLAPQQSRDFHLTIGCRSQAVAKSLPGWSNARQTMQESYRRIQGDRCRIETSNEQFNDWLNGSFADLFMLVTETEYGLYPYAGIPWFSTIFGRDGLITAMQTLWLHPDLARGVLAFLAAHQATEENDRQDAEPGKILHELRRGEMANLGEIPFGRYYGSIDSTPLFIMLAGCYYRRTGDAAFIRQLWPALEAAMAWIRRYGDGDGDGFVEYQKKLHSGLAQQGWKDSEDSVFHEDGQLAQAPIALCEVQGYVYQAQIQMAALAEMMGKKALADTLRAEAAQLRDRFHRHFWLPEMDIYALALDRDKQPCRVRASNAGHCLFTGIVPDELAPRIVRQMTAEGFFSGWGIRTVAEGQARYNPMSYHNGCIWPHDNALIAAGMSKYGHKDAVLKVLTGLFDASLFLDFRLPELFCGFVRRKGEGPTLYPVACIPQAWATGAVFMLVQACLGIDIDAEKKIIYFDNPILPPFLKQLKIINLAVGSASIDAELCRQDSDVTIHVLRRHGDVTVWIKKNNAAVADLKFGSSGSA